MNSRKKSKKNGAAREALSFSLYLFAIVAAAFLVHSFVLARDVVVGDSMADTLSDGDNLMINRLSYRLDKPKRFDIVVFPYRNQRNIWYIKRIIALPGENVRIDENGLIYVNERELPDRYATEPASDPGAAGGNGVTLGKDEYFVMGDNRNHSIDSRSSEVGPVRRDELVGKAVFRIWPLGKFGKIK